MPGMDAMNTTATIARLAIVLLIVCAAVSGSAQAEVIFSNLGSGDTWNGLHGFDITNTSTFSPVSASYAQRVAVGFSPTVDGYTLDSVDLAIQYVSGPNALNVSLLSDGVNRPSSVLASNIAASHLSAQNQGSLTRFQFASSPVLVKGAKYWIEVSPAGKDSSFLWSSNVLGYFGWMNIAVDPTQNWYDRSCTLQSAFRVNGTQIPEPSSAQPLIAGLMCFAAGAFRRKRL
jgi:glucose dehydrogenase